MPNFNWVTVKKMGRKKAVKLFKKVYPNLDFEKLYDAKFPPKTPKEKKGDDS